MSAVDQILERFIAETPSLENCRTQMTDAFKLITDSFRNGGKLLLCGNGGSAADCEHISGELLKGFTSKRTLSEKEQNSLPPELAGKIQGGLPAIPLPSLQSLSTAFANDVAPELVFAQAVWALGRPGDILLGLSTSGNSLNVVRAFQAAHAKEIKTVSLTGESGGALLGHSDICIRVPEKETYRVQQLHLPVYHCLCMMLEAELFS